MQIPINPPGIRVPYGGSSCATCIYLDPEDTSKCIHPGYVQISYLGKRPGERKFIDGETGQVVGDPEEFCCNFYDWER
jgi:hypothetical protein